MKVVIPSTTVRAKFLRRLPIGTVYSDPNNDYKYKVIEKQVGAGWSKVGVPCLEPVEPIDIQVPDNLIKVANPKRANIMTQMKQRILQLEDELAQLRTRSNDCLDKIRSGLDEDNYYCGKTDLYHLQSCFLFNVKHQGDIQAAKQKMLKLEESCWKDSELIQKLVAKQERIRSKLLDEMSN